MVMNMEKMLALLFLFVSLFIAKPSAWQTGQEIDTGGLSRASFPKGFVFGTATSAYQVEGAAKTEGRGPSIWDTFVSKPGNIANNATADVAVDEYHRYKEDVELMVKMNMDAYRFSISWSRIFPSGTGRINYKGVQYYNNLIDYLLERVPCGFHVACITPYVNLYHYDLPEGLEKAFEGWLNYKIVQEYAKYAEFCFKTFGDRVKYWLTLNEPRDIAALGYDNGIAAPARCSAPFGNCTAGNSSTEPYIVAHNLLLSHATAVKIYREKYEAKQKGKIGILLDFVWYEPLTNSSGDIAAAQRSRDFTLGWFLHPIVYGKYPESMVEIVGFRLPKFTEEQSLMANSNWLYIVPWGLYKAIMYIKHNYGNPTMIVSENGMDDPGNVTLPAGLHDTKRVHYYQSYLKNLEDAMKDGANVVGYFAWSLLDNFEWTLGYTSRFGLVYVDFQNLKRYPKMSAYWFSKLLQRPTN
eukprot:Gb_29260 [translate_table: standard]